MNSPLPATAFTASNPEADVQTTGRWFADEDIAFGCECADPALQIDCWGSEATKLKQDRY